MAKGDDIARAMDDAARLEKDEIPTDRQIAEQYEEDMAKAPSALKLLKRAKFLREPVSRRKTAAKKQSERKRSDAHGTSRRSR